MAETIVSPGVFTNEVDQSFLAGGIAQIGGAVLGSTVKGPAFIPTKVTSFGEFEQIFGSFTEDSYVPNVVNEYLANGDVITVTRLLYEDGYSLDNGLLAIVAQSGSTVSATFSSGSITFNHVPSGSLAGGGPDEVTIGNVDFTFVSESAGYSNSSTQIFVEHDNAGGTPTTTTVAENLRDAINNNTSLHGLAISASNSSNLLILSGSTAGVLSLAIATGSGGDTTATTENFAIPVNIQGGTGAVGGINYVTNVLHPTRPVTTDGNANLFEDSELIDNNSGSFSLRVSGSYAAGSDAAIGFDGSFSVAEDTHILSSILDTDNKHTSKVFRYSVKSNEHPVYVQYETKNVITTDGNRSGKIFEAIKDVNLSLQKMNIDLAQDYQTAATPFITAQSDGNSNKKLFKFHTLAHGTAVNHELKIAVLGIKTGGATGESSDPNKYATFDIQVRRVNTLTDSPVLNNTPFESDDQDGSARADVVETFRNMNLDPNSPRYIERIIGNQHQTVTAESEIVLNGEYANQSKYIRVEVSSAVTNESIAKTDIPFGFEALKSPIPNTAGGYNLYPVSYVTSQTPLSGQYNGETYHGFDFTNLNNYNYLAPIPTANSTTASNTSFSLGDVNQDAAADFPSSASPYTGSLQDALDAGTFSTNIKSLTRKFIVPFQGGFDGAKPNLKKYSGQYITNANTFGFDCSTTTSTGTKSYKKAYTLLENTDFYDINMLITPGLIDSLHPLVTAAARNLVEERQDTFYVMDSNALTDSITTVETTVKSIDSNYTATYYPWVQIRDLKRNKLIYVPPSVVVPRALTFNDATAAPWFAPAGLNRGGLETVLATYKNLTQKQRDTLYSARVNPIANFPNEGICIWGQKTLQGKQSALDRVNVRRLLIAVKKFIASSTKFLVFEQNTAATRNAFLSIVNPYLAQVQAEQGLSAFRVVMDSTNNTPATIDQNILFGQLFLQPTRTAEFIVLDFNIQPTGASFPE